ncbi:hypothetical protein [uncultured Microbulbifer sp.]|uniref:hypothetical protein n=1 Tax=uncultured Microbulbifer sp. TaxID=348147 RepID=UPI002614CF0E|nr:hypothetical protein [uncultured Microbulbifer sp.]
MNNNQPFFTQFMQAQELTAEQTGQVAGGGADIWDFKEPVLKYWLDDDELSRDNLER